jgi:peptidoglycan hydrolase-like protein with peptidoglycan-binding domain
VREQVLRAGAGRYYDGEGVGGRSVQPLWRRWLRRRPHDAIAGGVAALAAGAIVINALFLQTGPHPAPIFFDRPDPPPPAPAAAERKPAVAAAKPRADVVAEIQRELTRRGFYDGPADGLYGPKTDTAIRDFEEAAGLRPSAEPNDALLRAIAQSSVKPKPTAAPARRDPIAELLAPNRRVIAVQRALAAYGYGQIKPTGIYDSDTRAAIERFERENKLPVTGKISDQLARNIATMTGRPLE